MNLISFFKQIFDWRMKLQKKTNKELFALFSETSRINLEPQIFAGLILNSRKYDVAELIRVKESLIISLKNQFEKKYGKNESEIKRENLWIELFQKVSLGIILFFTLRKALASTNLLLEFEARTIIPYAGFILCLLPLLNLKKSHEWLFRSDHATLIGQTVPL